MRFLQYIVPIASFFSFPTDKSDIHQLSFLPLVMDEIIFFVILQFVENKNLIDYDLIHDRIWQSGQSV